MSLVSYLITKARNVPSPLLCRSHGVCRIRGNAVHGEQLDARSGTGDCCGARDAPRGRRTGGDVEKPSCHKENTFSSEKRGSVDIVSGLAIAAAQTRLRCETASVACSHSMM